MFKLTILDQKDVEIELEKLGRRFKTVEDNYKGEFDSIKRGCKFRINGRFCKNLMVMGVYDCSIYVCPFMNMGR